MYGSINYGSIGSDSGLSPEWCQAIIRTNAKLLSIGTLGTIFSEILIEIQTFSFKKMPLNILSGKWRPFCLGLNVLINNGLPVVINCFTRPHNFVLIDTTPRVIDSSDKNISRILLSDRHGCCHRKISRDWDLKLTTV